MRPASHAAGVGPAALALFLCGACPATPSALEATRLNVDLKVPQYQLNLALGGREVDDFSGLPDATGNSIDLGEQASIGLEFTEIIHNTFGWEFAFFYTHGDDEADGLDYDFHAFEFLVGGRYTYTGIEPLLPHLGIGALYSIADIEVPVLAGGTTKEDGSDFAGYVHTGVSLLIGRSFLIGVDGRATFLSGHDLEYIQAVLTLGWAF